MATRHCWRMALIHLSLTNCLRYVEVGDWIKSVFFTCFFVYSADGLAPCRKAGEVVIEYSVTLALPLFPSFQDGEIVQLFVVDAEEIVNALIGSVLGA